MINILKEINFSKPYQDVLIDPRLVSNHLLILGSLRSEFEHLDESPHFLNFITSKNSLDCSSKARLFASLFMALFLAVFNAVDSDWLALSHAHSLDSDWLAAG